MRTFNHKKTKGFTLVEMMVAVFVFSVVMVLATGAIFSVVSANKNAQALKSVMDNLSSALDSMSRAVRYGSTYHCGSGGSLTTPVSCSTGLSDGTDNVFAFIDRNNVQTIYEFLADSTASDGSGGIYMCLNSTALANCTRLTAQEVHITSLHFYVQGATPDEFAQQPQVQILISGYAKAGGTAEQPFNIETMIDQRNTMCKSNMPPGVCP